MSVHGCAGSLQLPLQGSALTMEGQCQGVYHNNQVWWPFLADCTVLTGGKALYSSNSLHICQNRHILFPTLGWASLPTICTNRTRVRQSGQDTSS